MSLPDLICANEFAPEIMTSRFQATAVWAVFTCLRITSPASEK
jgi:hypothetical protein